MVAEHCKVPGQASAQTLQETNMGEWSKWLGRGQATKSRTSGQGALEFTTDMEVNAHFMPHIDGQQPIRFMHKTIN